MNQLQERPTDAEKHVDWDGSAGHVFEDEDKVEPGEENCKCSYLPLPRSRTPALIVEAIDEDDS